MSTMVMENVKVACVPKVDPSLGDRIACMRVKIGWSQDQLASRISGILGKRIAQNQVSNWELNLYPPKADMLAAVAKALACSADYLLGLQVVVPEDLSTETETAMRLMERLPERDRWRCLEEIRKVYDERELQKQEFERLGRALDSVGGPELRRSIEAAVGVKSQ